MKIIVKGKGPVTLTKSDYKGSGGEGTVYCKEGTGYKIYHNSAKMIPEGKIEELSQLKISNVLAPVDVLTDGKTPIGFTMPYIDKTDYLCKLFTRTYREKNNISPDMIAHLVKEKQKTLMEIHKNKCLVVDYNEMNFLISPDYKTPYYIDVDSYKTPSFPPSALMESVRDRTTKTFSELSDWFSWAVVTFQMYMGIHPYKGRHPDYKPREWLKMMDDNISLFHPDVKIPAGCQDWSVIPRAHFEWYKKVFHHKERSIPPFADKPIPVKTPKPVYIPSTDKFDVTLIKDYGSKIRLVTVIDGIPYIVTDGNIHIGSRKVTFEKNASVELCRVMGDKPTIALFRQGKVSFYDLDKSILGSIRADAMMELNGLIYTTHNGIITENSCTRFSKKVIHHTQTVGNVFEPSHQVFHGVITQDIIQTCWLAIPHKEGTCANIHVKELDGHRIVDARYESAHKSGFCILIVEKKGNYKRAVIHFNIEDIESYSIRIEPCNIDSVNFTVLPNGLCITVIEDLKVEAFFDNNKIKEISGPPFDSGMRLFHDKGKVIFACKGKLHSVTLR